jgi:hypothetical protein
MPHFRKKPVVIQARQWTGENTQELIDWIDHTHARVQDNYLVIPTLEGNHFASVNDYVIQGVAGEFYACKPDIFARTYEAEVKGQNLSFETILQHIKAGGRAARSGWNGKGMFIFLVPGSTFTVNREPLLSILGEGTQVNYHGHIDMKTADGMIVPWLCSQTDMLANDWGVA